MPLLKETDREQLRKEFETLQNPVKLLFFTQALDCDYCGITQQVLEEVTGLSDKIILETKNFAIDREAAAEYKIARVPAIAILRVETAEKNGSAETNDRDYGIRFYGVPAGFEFAALLGDILDISKGDSGLSAQSKAALSTLKEPVHLQVFTTPT
jgi:alkyl hydroperoxide reductase subunit AhpF